MTKSYFLWGHCRSLCIFSVHSPCDVPSNTTQCSHSTLDKARPWWQLPRDEPSLPGRGTPESMAQFTPLSTHNTAPQKGWGKAAFAQLTRTELSKAVFGIHLKHKHLNPSKFHKILMEQSSSSSSYCKSPKPSLHTSRSYQFLLTSNNPRENKKLQLFCITVKT